MLFPFWLACPSLFASFIAHSPHPHPQSRRPPSLPLTLLSQELRELEGLRVRSHQSWEFAHHHRLKYHYRPLQLSGFCPEPSIS